MFVLAILLVGVIIYIYRETFPLFRYGIEEPSLPETNNKAFESAMAMFGAALSIAAAQNAEQEQK